MVRAPAPDRLVDAFRFAVELAFAPADLVDAFRFAVEREPVARVVVVVERSTGALVEPRVDERVEVMQWSPRSPSPRTGPGPAW